jgi:predicted transcriptional regulator
MGLCHTKESKMVKKVTVSLPDELLDQLDAEAEALGLSRSGIVQEASAHYLTHTSEERDVEQRRARAARVTAGFAAVQAMPLIDGRPGLDILREMRDTDDSAPVRRDTPKR